MLVTLGGKPVDVPGYDLVGSSSGSEGTLGVVTKVTVRVVPSPEAVKTLVAFYDSIDEAGRPSPTSSPRASCRARSR